MEFDEFYVLMCILIAIKVRHRRMMAEQLPRHEMTTAGLLPLQLATAVQHCFRITAVPTTSLRFVAQDHREKEFLFKHSHVSTRRATLATGQPDVLGRF
jgi:hypothetical protein